MRSTLSKLGSPDVAPLRDLHKVEGPEGGLLSYVPARLRLGFDACCWPLLTASGDGKPMVDFYKTLKKVRQLLVYVATAGFRFKLKRKVHRMKLRK